MKNWYLKYWRKDCECKWSRLFRAKGRDVKQMKKLTAYEKKKERTAIHKIKSV